MLDRLGNAVGPFKVLGLRLRGDYRVTNEKRVAENDALVREFLAGWERRDTDFIVESFTEDGVYHSVPLTPIVGRTAIRNFVSGFVGKPPGRLEIRNQVASEDVVMNERVDYITLNGRPVTLPICGVFEIEAGRIRAWREYFDLAPAKAAYAED
jgi:limonene-1,2-epoxide hydrolase